MSANHSKIAAEMTRQIVMNIVKYLAHQGFDDDDKYTIATFICAHMCGSLCALHIEPERIDTFLSDFTPIIKYIYQHQRKEL